MEIVISFLAGVLTLLNPCVLPVLPLVLSSAMSNVRWGIFYFSFGLILTFAVLGGVIASLGLSIGLTQQILRPVSAGFLIVFGLIMVVPLLQRWFSSACGRIVQGASNSSQRVDGGSPFGQIMLGGLTGFIWAPCSGPSFGIALTMAASGENLLQAIMRLGAFALGAAVTLWVVSYAITHVFWRKRLTDVRYGSLFKLISGWLFVVLGVMILTGLDKALERFMLDILPRSFLGLSTLL